MYRLKEVVNYSVGGKVAKVVRGTNGKPLTFESERDAYANARLYIPDAFDLEVYPVTRGTVTANCTTAHGPRQFV